MNIRRYSKSLAGTVTSLILLSMQGTSAMAAAVPSTGQTNVATKTHTAAARETQTGVSTANWVVWQESSGYIAFNSIPAEAGLLSSSLSNSVCQWYSGGPPNDTLLTSIVIDSGNSDTIYTSQFWGGLYKTLDGGKIWTRLDGWAQYALTADPFNPGIVYSGRNDWSYGVVRYSQGGSSYALQMVGDGTIGGLAIAPSNSETLYAVGFYHIYKTVNSGDSWSAVWSSDQSSGSGYGEARLGVAVHPNNPNIALVATASNNNYTVMKTTDGGVTWTPTGLQGIQAREIVFDPYSSNIVYAATLDGGIQKSVDSGDTWTNTTSGLPSQWAKAIVIDPNENSRLFAAIGSAITEQHIYTSYDGGITWKDFGGPTSSTFGLAIDNHGILHAATLGNGVWSCDTTNDINLPLVMK
jgi:photosystem II stability/assembly factor-like uncharacterized protein